jgi:hypothetical protein
VRNPTVSFQTGAVVDFLGSDVVDIGGDVQVGDVAAELVPPVAVDLAGEVDREVFYGIVARSCWR